MSMEEMDENVHSMRITPSRKIFSLRHNHKIESRHKGRNYSSVQFGRHKRDLGKKKKRSQIHSMCRMNGNGQSNPGGQRSEKEKLSEAMAWQEKSLWGAPGGT